MGDLKKKSVKHVGQTKLDLPPSCQDSNIRWLCSTFMPLELREDF